ncbi:MAG: 50S ribosomal protein L21 [Patescibacteria group bacterium]
MFAVIATGGKQYIAKEGDELKIEKIKGQKGDAVTFDKVLLIAEDDGSKVDVGTPNLDTKISAEIVEQGRGKKVTTVKYKNKIRYKKRINHRQEFTKVQIKKIG